MNDDPDSSGIAIVIDLRDPAWEQLLPDVAERARRAAQAALAAAPETGLLPRPLELSILLADDAFVRDLNRDHRGQDRPTNVLSFPICDVSSPNAPPPGQPLLLGDVALARETLLREARADGKAPAAHLSHLIVHGVLHLLGYDHEKERDAEEMEALEIRVLANLGYPDPYNGGDAGQANVSLGIAGALQH